MKRLLACFAVLSMGAALAGCAYPIRNDAIVETRPPAYEWKSLAPGELQDTLVIVTMSGGGTRATALAMSVLRAMDKIKLASGASLADEIDIVSSVSGGSVTAGYFALYGTAGLPTLENELRPPGRHARHHRRGIEPGRARPAGVAVQGAHRPAGRLSRPAALPRRHLREAGRAQAASLPDPERRRHGRGNAVPVHAIHHGSSVQRPHQGEALDRRRRLGRLSGGPLADHAQELPAV